MPNLSVSEPTTSDKILDKMVEVCRDVKAGNQVQGLWKVFNIMVAFIKGQANLIQAMDVKLKQQERKLERLGSDVNALRESVEYLRKTRQSIGPVN